MAALVRKLSIVIRGEIPGFDRAAAEFHDSADKTPSRHRGRELIREINSIYMANIFERAFSDLMPVSLFSKQALNGEIVTTLVFVDGAFEDTTVNPIAISPFDIHALKQSCRDLYRVIVWSNPDDNGNPDDSIVIMGTAEVNHTGRNGHQVLRLKRTNNKLVAYVEPNG